MCCGGATPHIKIRGGTSPRSTHGSVPCARVRVRRGSNPAFIVSTVNIGQNYGYRRMGDEICVHPGDAHARPDLFEPLDPLPAYEPEIAQAVTEQIEPGQRTHVSIEELIAQMGKEAAALLTPEDEQPAAPTRIDGVTVNAETIAALTAYLEEQEIEPVEVTERPAAPVVAAVVPAPKRKVVRKATP